MQRARRTALVTVLGLLLTLPAAARAEPLQITSGRLVLDFEGHFFQLIGANFEATMPSTNLGVVLPVVFTGNVCFEPCAPGTVVDLSLRTPGEVTLGTGSIVANGQRVDNVTFSGSLSFRATPAPLTGLVDDSLDLFVVTPFVFGGFLRAQWPATMGTGEIFTQLSGMGTVGTTYLFRDGQFRAEGEVFSYRFDPIPEPSTLLLMGTGLAALLGRARRRRNPLEG